MIAVQAALSGALIGGLYALMAAGLSVTWGVLRVINLAHFGLILVGAYLTYQLATAWGLDPILTVAVTAPLLFVVGAGAAVGLRPAEHRRVQLAAGQLRAAHHRDPGRDERLDGRLPPSCRATRTRTRTSALHLGPIALPVNRACVAFGFAVLLARRRASGAAATPSSAGVCAPSRRTERWPPHSASTIAGSGCCWAGPSGASAAVAGMVFALANTSRRPPRTSGSAPSSPWSSWAGSATCWAPCTPASA